MVECHERPMAPSHGWRADGGLGGRSGSRAGGGRRLVAANGIGDLPGAVAVSLLGWTGFSFLSMGYPAQRSWLPGGVRGQLAGDGVVVSMADLPSDVF